MSEYWRLFVFWPETSPKMGQAVLTTGGGEGGGAGHTINVMKVNAGFKKEKQRQWVERGQKGES